MSPAAKTIEPASGRVVTREVEIAAPVAAVWKALTDADELIRWFPLEARVTPGAGGAVWMSWHELYTADSAIDCWEPERRLRLAFPAHPPYLLATDYHLDAKGGSTVLRVVTSGFEAGTDWDAMYDGVSTGWDFELTGLKHYLERHRGIDRRVAWVVAPAPTDRRIGWSRLVGPQGWFRAEPADLVVGGAYSAAAGPTLLAGTILRYDPERQVVATVTGLNDALLRIELERHPDRGQAVAWLATYDVDAAEVASIQRDWAATLPGALASSSG